MSETYESNKESIAKDFYYITSQFKQFSTSPICQQIFKSRNLSLIDTYNKWKVEKNKEDEEKRKRKEYIKKQTPPVKNTEVLIQHMLDSKLYESDKLKEKEKEKEKDKEKINSKEHLSVKTNTNDVPVPVLKELPIPSPIAEVINNVNNNIKKELTKEELISQKLAEHDEDDIFNNKIDDDEDENDIFNSINVSPVDNKSSINITTKQIEPTATIKTEINEKKSTSPEILISTYNNNIEKINTKQDLIIINSSEQPVIQKGKPSPIMLSSKNTKIIQDDDEEDEEKANSSISNNESESRQNYLELSNNPRVEVANTKIKILLDDTYREELMKSNSNKRQAIKIKRESESKNDFLNKKKILIDKLANNTKVVNGTKTSKEVITSTKPITKFNSNDNKLQEEDYAKRKISPNASELSIPKSSSNRNALFYNRSEIHYANLRSVTLNYIIETPDKEDFKENINTIIESLQELRSKDLSSVNTFIKSSILLKDCIKLVSTCPISRSLKDTLYCYVSIYFNLNN